MVHMGTVYVMQYTGWPSKNCTFFESLYLMYMMTQKGVPCIKSLVIHR